jgi:hypothetical protein
MNRYTSNPTLSPEPEEFLPDYREDLDAYSPAFDDGFDPAPPRATRDLGRRNAVAAPSRRSPRGPRAPEAPRRGPRQVGKPSGRKTTSAASRQYQRYRYSALVAMMVFAAVGGLCLGFSGIGGYNANIGLILVGIPALLLSIGWAALYVYF